MVASAKLGRLLGIVLLLRSREWLSAQELADRFGVSLRTTYRDVETLQEYGVPIRGVPGREGGYRLDSESPLPQLLFSSHEALGLYLLGAGGSDLPSPLRQAGERALAELEGPTESEVADLLSRAASRIHFDTEEWYWRDEGTALLPVIREALFQQKRIEIEYMARRSVESSSILLAPYGLVWKGGEWYVVGCAAEHAIGRYRLSRIRRVSDTGEHFQYPSDFELRRWWKKELQVYGKGDICVRLRVYKDARDDFRRLATKNDSLIEYEGDIMRVTLFVDDWEWLVPLLLSFSPSVVVEAPDDLRERAARDLREALQHYAVAEPPTAAGAIHSLQRSATDDSRVRATRGRSD